MLPEHRYTIEFSSLLELILISEFQDLRDFFKENFQIKKISEPRKQGPFYSIFYTYESANTKLVGYKLSDVHYRNSFLSDFNFDTEFDHKKFLVKVQ